MKQCNADACCQGRKPCPCPEACEVTDERGLIEWLSRPSVFWTAYAVALVTALMGASVAVLL